MSKVKYYYNPETLNYERYKPPLKKRLADLGYFSLMIVILAVLMRIAFDNLGPSPKISHFQILNQKIRTEFMDLNQKIAKSELLLQEIQKRDDKVYRSVLDLSPIPGSVREAGYGGAEILFSELASNGSNSLVNQTAKNLEKLSAKARIQSGSLGDLFRMAQSQQKLIASKPSIQPLSPADTFRITSYYGYRQDPFTRSRRMHQGVDFAGEIGLSVYATGEGRVISAIDAKYGYGKEVIIDHGFGYVSRYAHLQRIGVKPGQSVKRGQYIGKLGNSGRSTGPHLHYEVIFGDRSLNPRLFYFENLNAVEYKAITLQAMN